jgi:acyl-CoA thioester hydrolase
MEPLPKLDQFPLMTYEKLRYVDTDRQGHVNNAVFVTMLETGRVEVLYNPEKPLMSENCSFVIVNLNVNFLAEITWPGRVEIGSRVAKIGRSSVTIEQALFQDEVCVATATTVVAQVNDIEKRSQVLNDSTVAFFESLKSPDLNETLD